MPLYVQRAVLARMLTHGRTAPSLPALRSFLRLCGIKFDPQPHHGGGDEEPRESDSRVERRFSKAPPGAGGDTGAYGPTLVARPNRSGIKNLFGELKRELQWGRLQKCTA